MKKMPDKLFALLLILLLLGGCVRSPAPLANEETAELRNAVQDTIKGKPSPAPLQNPIESKPPAAGTAELSEVSPASVSNMADEKSFAELAPTINMSFEELVGDNGDYAEPQEYPASGTFYVIVDLYHQVVMVYEKDSRGEHTIPVRYMICSTGRKGMATRRGVFKTGSHKERFGFFKNDNVYGQYWTHIVSRTYFHSILYTSRNAKTYTRSSYDNLGSRASHGCIRLLVPDARFLYYHLAPGSQVEIRAGSSEDTETAEIKRNLKIASQPKKRPALVKGKIPNTDNWSIDTFLHNYPNTVKAG